MPRAEARRASTSDDGAVRPIITRYTWARLTSAVAASSVIVMWRRFSSSRILAPMRARSSSGVTSTRAAYRRRRPCVLYETLSYTI